MTDSDFLLVFPHIPKTGGTTLLFHFQEHLGEDQVASYGPFARISRFFDNKFQWEEVGQDALSRLRVVMGHGVRQNLLQLMPHRDVRFLVVLREPTAHVRSRFNHAVQAKRLRGLNLPPDEFWQQTETDMMARYLVARFPAFSDPEASDLAAQAKVVLSRFDYVCATEALDQQVGALAGLLGVPDRLTRRRVASDKHPLPISDADITAANPVDAMLQRAAASVCPAGPEQHPLGFDAEGKLRAISKVRSHSPGTEALRLRGYRQLATWLCGELRAEAALEKLGAGDFVALQKPDLFTDMLREAWAALRPQLGDRQLALSARALANFRKNRETGR